MPTNPTTTSAAAATKADESPETLECKCCGNEVDYEETYHLDGTGDVCRECYDQEIETCQLCGDTDVQEKQISDFILCKAELSTTAKRPPGIYRVLSYPFMTSSMLGGGWIHGYDVLFIDKLPKADEHYEISGKICTNCAAPYEAKRKQAYGRRPLAKFRFDKKGWEAERAHTRATILANPDILRDLECDADEWGDLQELYDLPELPTYHEWVFLEHRGVKVYYAGYKSSDSWMTLRPEPRFRTNGHGMDAFAISGLPNWKKHHDAHETAAAHSLQRTFRNIDKPPRSLAEHKRWLSPYDTDRAIAKAVTIEAIELGYITQQGIFDRRGKPLSCR